MTQDQFTGKVALVTGAGRGIGRAVALALGAGGADVMVHYHATRDGADGVAEQIRSSGRRAEVFQADIGSKADIDRLYQAVEATFGRLDILVNNAAMFSDVPLEEVTEELWDRIQSVNLKGQFFSCQAAARIMCAQPNGGVIVNFASGGGVSPFPGYRTSPAYAASKAGVIILTKHLAFSLAPRVRVNAIVPGMIDSKPRPMSEATRDRFGRNTPLDRVGEPDEIASVAVFLASDASRYMTGQVLNVDGGVLM